MEVAQLGGALVFRAPDGAWNVTDARREGVENRVEVVDDSLLAANHHAVAAVESPNAAARADIDIVDATRGDVLRATDVVDVIGIAAVDDGVAFFEKREEFIDRGIHGRRRNHEPDRAWAFEFGNKIRERCGADGAFLHEGINGGLGAVEDGGFVTVAKEAEDHVGAHAAEADHAELEWIFRHAQDAGRSRREAQALQNN